MNDNSYYVGIIMWFSSCCSAVKPPRKRKEKRKINIRWNYWQWQSIEIITILRRYISRAQIDKYITIHEIRNYIDYRRQLLFLVWITIETSYLIQSSPRAIIHVRYNDIIQFCPDLVYNFRYSLRSYYVYYFNWYNIISQ